MYYRIYSLDLSAVHFTDVHAFEALTDTAAILTVKARSSDVPRELWNRGRKIMDFAQ